MNKSYQTGEANMYSVSLHLKGKKVVVAGGGKIATRKIRSLLKEEANITVISPSVSAEILHWRTEKRIKVYEREVIPSDLKDAFLTFLATNDEALNEKLARSLPPNQLVSVASDYKCGNFSVPAQLKRGKLSVSVSTSGASPSLAKEIRNDLEVLFSDEYIQYVEFLDQCRKVIKSLEVDHAQKETWLKLILEERFKNEQETREEFLAYIKQK
ncbi:NAD(P)-dependent oxidoreductase [Priestia koreensis]